MEKNKNVNASVLGGILFSILTLVALAFPFLTWTGATNGQKGYDYLNGGGMEKAYVILSIILCCILILALAARFLNVKMTRTMLYSVIVTVLSAALMIVAILLFVNIKSGSLVESLAGIQYSWGAILYLITSIMTMIACASLLLTNR